MTVEISCPSCGHTWQPAAAPDCCERCGEPMNIATAIAAEPIVEPVEEEDDWFDAVRAPGGELWLAFLCGVVALSGGVDVLLAMAHLENALAIAPIMERHQYASVLSFAALLLFLATVVVGSGWLYAMYANLQSLAVGALQATPGQALGRCLRPWGWFLQPYRLLQEIWRASHPGAPPDSEDWKRRPGSKLVALWWILFLIHCVRPGIFVDPFLANEPQLSLSASSAVVGAIAAGAGVAASALLAVIAVRLELRKWRRYERLVDS